jgi:hypothetical protein
MTALPGGSRVQHTMFLLNCPRKPTIVACLGYTGAYERRGTPSFDIQRHFGQTAPELRQTKGEARIPMRVAHTVSGGWEKL